MKLSILSLLLLALPWVLLLLIDRAETSARLGRDLLYALSLAATLWLLTLAAIDGPPRLLALLALPAVVVLLVEAWQALRRVVAAARALFRLTPSRKAA